ncbi:MAG: hypothetical protein ACRYG8_00775 [Janthinobacterium lividum]
MDSYDLQARHAPIVFVLLPIIIVALALVPSLGGAKLAAGSIGLILVTGLGFVATRLGRAMGYARQDALFASWDGKPTTAMLRLRDTRLNPQTKLIYRDRLTHLGPHFPLPTAADEAETPDAADIKIDAAMSEVRTRAKARGIKLVHRENINYGAARNAFGLKPFGLGACLIGAIGLGAAIYVREKPSIMPLDIVVAMAIICITATWLLACRGARVRHHAEAYALALFEAIDVVVTQPKVSKPRSTTPRKKGQRSGNAAED